MARYLDEEQAKTDGFAIVHEADKHRFALVKDDAVLGEAHYTLREGSSPSIDFDHTVVDPSLRGTGLSGLLAERALTDNIVKGRQVKASCWFIEGYIAKHPQLLDR